MITVKAEKVEIVRVLRLVEYEGPRTLVEEQVRRSLSGTRFFEHKHKGKIRITAVTLDQFPRVLEEARGVLDERQTENCLGSTL